jgi:hypothetical protein
MKILLLTGIAALFLATGMVTSALARCDTLHTSDTRGIWQCGDVCVRVYGNAPREVTIDGVGGKWGGNVTYKWSYRKIPFEASLNGKRCKMLEQTYDYEKSK